MFRASSQLVAFLSAIILGGNAWAQVVSGHPRIYLRSDGLDALRARAASTDISPYYDQLKSRMDSTASRHSNDEVAGFEMWSLALCHVVEAPSNAYRDKIISGWLRNGYSAGGIGHWDLPFQVMAHSIALDWMWGDLTAPQRQTFADTIVALMDDLHDYAPHDAGANQMSDYSNQLPYHLGSLAFAGVVLSGEGLADTKASAYLDEAGPLIRDHIIPAMNQEAGGDAELSITSGFVGNGGWGEDMGHTSMTHPFFGRMLEAWRTGTGEDLFPRANGLRTLGQYIVYMTRPDGNLSPKGNGAYGNGVGDKHQGSVGALLSARYGDSFGRYLKDVSWTGTTYGFHQMEPVLWYDASVPDLNLDALPGTIHFQGQGEVVVRSGFGANDTWIYLRSGPIYNGHQHDDQGNLLVEAFGGQLLVEDAANGRDPTAHHNTLLVGGEQIAYGNNEVQHAQAVAGTSQERGRVTEVDVGSAYTYVATDFSNAYADGQVATPKAGKVTRELVVVLPEMVVVRDRVLAAGAEALWHVWSGSVTTDAGQGTMEIVDGSGRAWGTVLAPASFSFATASQNATDRITVTPAGSPSTTELLHLFYLTEASSSFVPSATLVDDGTAFGVQVTDRAGDNWEIRFDADAVGLLDVTRNGGSVGGPDGAGGSGDASGGGGDATAGGGDGAGTAGGDSGSPTSDAGAEEQLTAGCGCGASSAPYVWAVVLCASSRRRRLSRR